MRHYTATVGLTVNTLALFVGVAWAGVTHAQRSPVVTDSSGGCKHAVAALTAGGLKTLPIVAGQIGSCGQPMAAALAHALRRSRGATLADSLTLSDLMGYATMLRSPILLDAAQAIATDHSASAIARITGLYLLASFFGRPLSATPWIGTAA